jgi:hypothetical protein
MANFAKLNEDNIVLQVIVVNNSDIDVANEEQSGIAFIESLFGNDFVWKQTSYNGTIRKNFAGVGYTYDATKDAFIAPKPFESWILDDATCHWKAPTAMPNDNKKYYWDEETTSWVEIPVE